MLAPIAIFAYNRPEHLKQTVEALKENRIAKDSELYVFADGVKAESHVQGVQSVRQYIETIDGFKKINIIKRESNIGLARSIITGVTEVVEKHGQIIVLEDDLITSPHFLEFMNNALQIYEHQDDVVCIQGYMYPVKKTLPDTFFLRMIDSWGWATWKRGWDLFESDGQKLLEKLKAKKLEKDFDFNGSYPFIGMLEGTISGQINSWAVRWYASIYLNNKLGLFPGKSFVQNIGMDGSGVHCDQSFSSYNSPLSSNPILPSGKIPFQENLFARNEIIKIFHSLQGSFIKRMSIRFRKGVKRFL
jgi:hypothetical protein